jgi:hypothetical protein
VHQLNVVNISHYIFKLLFNIVLPFTPKYVITDYLRGADISLKTRQLLSSSGDFVAFVKPQNSLLCTFVTRYVSCLFLCRYVSSRVLSSLVLSRLVSSRLVFCCFVMSRFVSPCLALSRLFLSCLSSLGSGCTNLSVTLNMNILFFFLRVFRILRDFPWGGYQPLAG